MSNDPAAFTGAPVSVLSPSTDVEQPVPGGTAPTPRAQVKPAPVKAAAKRSRASKRAPKRTSSASSSTTASAVNGVADAAAAALEKEAQAKRGRPSNADVKNAQLETGLRNFYVGLGGMATVAGSLLKSRRLRDVGTAMLVQADDCAKSLVAAADQSPALREALEWLTKAGGASLVLAAHGPIIMAAMGLGAPDVEQGSSDGQAAGMDIASLLGVMGNMGGMFDVAADPAA